jgi:hypothetical protein
VAGTAGSCSSHFHSALRSFAHPSGSLFPSPPPHLRTSNGGWTERSVSSRGAGRSGGVVSDNSSPADMDICCWGGEYYWFIRVGSRVMCVFYLLSFSSLVLLISVSCHYSLSNLCVFAQFVSFTIQNYGYIRDSQNATILASLSLRFHSVFFFVYAFISHYTITNREVQNPIKHFCSATTAQHRLKQFSAVEIVNPSNAIPIF